MRKVRDNEKEEQQRPRPRNKITEKRIRKMNSSYRLKGEHQQVPRTQRIRDNEGKNSSKCLESEGNEVMKENSHGHIVREREKIMKKNSNNR